MDYMRSCAPYPGGKKFKGFISNMLLEEKLEKNSDLVIEMPFHFYGPTDVETLQNLPLKTPKW